MRGSSITPLVWRNNQWIHDELDIVHRSGEDTTKVDKLGTRFIN
jgi:hypothetical protein